MSMQFPKYTEEEGISFMYLIGYPNGGLFKFGVSKTPERRLYELKRKNYGADFNFPINNSEILFKSTAMPSGLAFQT